MAEYANVLRQLPTRSAATPISGYTTTVPVTVSLQPGSDGSGAYGSSVNTAGSVTFTVAVWNVPPTLALNSLNPLHPLAGGPSSKVHSQIGFWIGVPATPLVLATP